MSANFVIPLRAISYLYDFLFNDKQRCLILQGISGAGKTELLKHIARSQYYTFYIDLSTQNTPLIIMEEISRQLGDHRSITTVAQERLRLTQDNYISNCGNVHIASSNIDRSSLTVQTEIHIESYGSDIDSTALESTCRSILFDRLRDHPLLYLLFDQFEAVDTNLGILAFIRLLLHEIPKSKVIVATNRMPPARLWDDEHGSSYSIDGLSAHEACQYLTKRGIDDQATTNDFYSFCKGHPLILRMLTDVYLKRGDLDLSLSAASREAKIKYIIDMISNTLADDLKDVFYYLPLCRLFEPNLLMHCFGLKTPRAEELLRTLEEDLYVRRVDEFELYRFHDLLTKTQRLQVPVDEAAEFDRKVVEYYEGGHSRVGGLHRIIEPFHHLQYVDERKAFAYFENIYKPALDRNNRALTSILVSQVMLDIVDDANVRNWYNLRIGGYFRQFRAYEKGAEYFKKVRSTNQGRDPILDCYALNNLAICYMYLNKLDAAMSCYAESIALCEVHDLIDIRGHNHQNMGNCHSYLHSFDKALEYYALALHDYDEAGITGLFRAKVFANYSSMLRQRGDHGQAMKCLSLAEREYIRDDDYVGAATCSLERIQVMLCQGHYKKAWRATRKVAEVIEAIYADSDVRDLRCNLHYIISIVAMYNGMPKEWQESACRAIGYSLSVSSTYHEFMVKRILRTIVLLADDASTNRFLHALSNHGMIDKPFRNAISEYYHDELAKKWAIRDPQKKLHIRGCDSYRKGNYLEDCIPVKMHVLLLEKDIETCACMSAQHRPR